MRETIVVRKGQKMRERRTEEESGRRGRKEPIIDSG